MFADNTKNKFYQENDKKDFNIYGNKDPMQERQRERENKNEQLRQNYLNKNINNDKPEQTKYYKYYVE